jgi:hypothetical protein
MARKLLIAFLQNGGTVQEKSTLAVFAGSIAALATEDLEAWVHVQYAFFH